MGETKPNQNAESFRASAAGERHALRVVHDSTACLTLEQDGCRRLLTLMIAECLTVLLFAALRSAGGGGGRRQVSFTGHYQLQILKKTFSSFFLFSFFEFLPFMVRAFLSLLLQTEMLFRN